MVNLSRNPTAANNVTDWTGPGWARQTGQSVGDTGRTTCGRFTMGTGAWQNIGGAGGIAASSATTGGRTYSYVAWIRTSVARRVRHHMARYTTTTGGFLGPEFGGNNDVDLVANTWTKIRGTGTVPTGGTYVRVAVHINLPNTGTAGTLDVGAIRIVEGADSALEFADGDTAGWAWDGTRGNSTSAVSSGGPGAVAPTVAAGADASVTTGTVFARTATEDDGGAAITARSWSVVSGPAQTGTTLATTAALSWTPSATGVYVLRYSATNTAGTGTDDVTVTVTAVPSPSARVGISGRHFTRDGARWFWMADTAWALFRRTREEISSYLDTRRDQGFNTIMAVMMNPQAGGPTNAYGVAPYTGGTISNRNDAYWTHVDYFVAECAARGMVAALHPMWADGQAGTVVTASNAETYGRFLGARYAAATNVTWTFGGDYPPTGQETMWANLATGIRAGGSEHLITYHPQGDQTSAQFFNTAPWIDWQTMQGGHCRNYSVDRDLMATSYGNARAQPWIDGEPIYEQHPYCWQPASGYATALDCRRDAYWRVLGGAAGHTYGHHSVWQFYTGTGGTSSPIDTWQTALGAEAANDMRWVRALFESRPRLEPSNGLVTNPGTDAMFSPAAIDTNATTIVVYSAGGASRTVTLDSLGGDTVAPWWYDPRTGEATALATRPSSGSVSFTPPTSNTDWVLVLDSVDAGYDPPGTGVVDPGEPGEPGEPTEPGRRNEVGNPAAALDAAGWLGAGTHTRVTGQTGPRATAVEIAHPATAWMASLGCPGVPAQTGQTWSAVGWLWSSVAYTYQVGLVGWTGTTYRADLAAPVQVPVPAQTWTEVRLPPAALTAGANTWELVNFQVNMPAAGTGTLRVTACRLEQIDDPEIVYADGDTPGWAWDGIPGASTSTAAPVVAPVGPEPGRALLAV